MLKNLRSKVKKNLEIFSLILLIIITVFLTSYFNYKKNHSQQTYENLFDNIYLKKTLSYIINNLDPNLKN